MARNCCGISIFSYECRLIPDMVGPTGLRLIRRVLPEHLQNDDLEAGHKNVEWAPVGSPMLHTADMWHNYKVSEQPKARLLSGLKPLKDG
ncbi:hypothetical protein MPTK1_8g15052 [Marchantia polymorpha subsp. ruderalis]